jgi:hypothetical protein
MKKWLFTIAMACLVMSVTSVKANDLSQSFTKMALLSSAPEVKAIPSVSPEKKSAFLVNVTIVTTCGVTVTFQALQTGSNESFIADIIDEANGYNWALCDEAADGWDVQAS